MVKKPLANAGDMGLGFDPGVGKIPWSKLHGEPHGQKSLVGYSLGDGKESDTTAQHNASPDDVT